MASTGGRRGVRRAAAIAAAAVAYLACAGSAPAGAARTGDVSTPSPFGVNGGVLWPDGGNLLSSSRHTAAIARSGLRSVRVIPFWNLVEPEPPNPRTGAHRFVWTRTDAIADNLARNDLRWDALLGFSTPWGGVFPGTTAGPPKVKPFSEYAAAIAGRYGRGGDFWKANPHLPYVPIINYQVWNEPNLTASLTGMEPEPYANLYAATRTAILAVDPHARVAVGGLVHSSPAPGNGNASPFLERMFAARPDLAGHVDAVGLTIYRQSPAQVMTQVAGARRVLDALGERSTPIDIDETGWATRGGVMLTDIAPVSEPTRAAFLTQLVGLLAASDCGLGVVSPFAWVTAEDNPGDASAWYGLADRQSANLKPSGAAYVAAAGAATDPGPPAAGAQTCGRPDLPRLLQRRAPALAAFKVTLSRRCSARRLIVRYTLGPGPEPFQRLTLTLPGSSRPRVVEDPDAGGPRTARTSLQVRLPRKPGTVTVVAHDELGRAQATGTARLAACRARRR
ncbi:MAG: hypothetical protein JWN65_3574 [Solirubrobacterales bacterium]|nr:hypothetical protein [Solirubrobacterales bacterium]